MGENNDINKFRVWDNLYQKYTDENYEITWIDTSGKIFLQIWIDGEPRIECNAHEFRFVIERCTGLRDKNGKLIYAGDIVEVVYFDREGSDYTMQGCISITEFGVMLDYVKGEHFKAYTGGSENVYLCEWLRDFVDDPEAQIEIIDNIHKQEEKP